MLKEIFFSRDVIRPGQISSFSLRQLLKIDRFERLEISFLRKVARREKKKIESFGFSFPGHIGDRARLSDHGKAFTSIVAAMKIRLDLLFFLPCFSFSCDHRVSTLPSDDSFII